MKQDSRTATAHRSIRYSIWKIARMLGRSESTVKRYEETGLIPKARRDPVSNYRYWDENQKKKIESFARTLNAF